MDPESLRSRCQPNKTCFVCKAVRDNPTRNCPGCFWLALEGESGWAPTAQIFNDILALHGDHRTIIIAMLHPSDLFGLPDNYVNDFIINESKI